MDFKLTPEQESFRDEIHSFIQKEITPELVEELNTGLGPREKGWEFIRKMGAKRWLVPSLPWEFGGLGGSYVQHYIFYNEMAHFFPAMFMLFGVEVVAPILLQVGTDEQKKTYIPRIARGEIEFALGYTEPEAGSDLANINMRAVEQDDHYIINGQKMYNTGCHYAQYHWICARTEVTEKKHRGLSIFIIPLDSPGITISPMYTSGGERTNEVFYDNVKVPKENLVGEKNRGFYYMMLALDHERSFPVSQLRRALEYLIQYAKQTKQSGALLSQKPSVRHKLADLATEIEVAQGIADRVIWLIDNDQAADYEASMLKMFVSELEQRLAYAGLQIMGLRGIQLREPAYSSQTADWIPHWFLSITRRTIAAGSSEIQRNVIARRGLGLPG